MTDLEMMNDTLLQEEYSSLVTTYKDSQAQKYDMARGVPSPEQLDLASEMFNCLSGQDCIASDGTDCRNYGGVDGLPEAKELFAQILEVSPEEVIIGGNSSLNMEYDLMTRAILFGFPGSKAPWSKLPKVKMIFPVPGYDRHFAVCQQLGIEIISVDYLKNGPDMDRVEELVASDPAIKGIWCVPKYSNPTGITYTDDSVERLAKMPVKAEDFRIIWDNAYAIHHLTDNPPRLLNMMNACKKAGNQDRLFMFASTSKVSFAGAGIAVMACSEVNRNWLKKLISIQTIGPDKLNQLRHVRFFKDLAGIEAHMRKHAALLKPKFDLALSILESELGGKNLATWSNPLGGYFISLNTLPGCAKKIVAKATELGVLVTPAGATFPYGKDPDDQNIRFSPTFVSLPELAKAMELFALCIKMVSVEQELTKRGLSSLVVG